MNENIKKLEAFKFAIANDVVYQWLILNANFNLATKRIDELRKIHNIVFEEPLIENGIFKQKL